MTAVRGGTVFRRSGRVMVLAVLLGCLCSPAFAQRLVFAHYMVTNQDYQGNHRNFEATLHKSLPYQSI